MRQNIAVSVNTSTRVDADLQPGSVNMQIEVTAAPPALQTDRADTSVSLSTVQTANLPYRHQPQLPGPAESGSGNDARQLSAFAVSSMPARSLYRRKLTARCGWAITIRSKESTTTSAPGLLQFLIPPIEAIQTVDVSTSNFEASLGRASGAVTNVILKSGTNSIHGSAYEFTQNSEFNARSFFNPSVGHQVYNYFGGNVGGPILKNKLFYFGDFLRVADHEANTNLQTIPTPAQIGGNLALHRMPSMIRLRRAIRTEPAAPPSREIRFRSTGSTRSQRR